MAGPAFDGTLTGEIRAPTRSLVPMPMDERRIIGHRAMLEITRPGSIVNLGIGMPEVSPCCLSQRVGAGWPVLCILTW